MNTKTDRESAANVPAGTESRLISMRSRQVERDVAAGFDVGRFVSGDDAYYTEVEADVSALLEHERAHALMWLTVPDTTDVAHYA